MLNFNKKTKLPFLPTIAASAFFVGASAEATSFRWTDELRARAERDFLRFNRNFRDSQDNDLRGQFYTSRNIPTTNNSSTSSSAQQRFEDARDKTWYKVKELAQEDSSLQELYTKLQSVANTNNSRFEKLKQQHRFDNPANHSENIILADKRNEHKKSPDTQEEIKLIVKIFEVLDEKENQEDVRNGLVNLLNHDGVRNRYLVNPKKAKSYDKLTALQAPDTVAESISQSVLTTSNLVDQRVRMVSGVGAGEYFENIGLWARGHYAIGDQKAANKVAGYKFNQKGVTIGADVGEELLIGGAYSYYMNNIQNSFDKKNKEDIKSHIGTVYGKIFTSPESHITFQTSYGKSNIDLQRNTGDLDSNIARAKTSATNYGGKGLFGVDFKSIPNTVVTTSVGIGHNQVNVKDYKEQGEGLNRTVASRRNSRSSLLTSISAKTSHKMAENMVIQPEIYAGIDYSLVSSGDDSKFTLIEGVDPIITPANRKGATLYNIGTSATMIMNGDFEATASYDFGTSKGFTSHTGTLKLRVNF